MSKRTPPKIYIDTVGYYHSDIEFKAIPNRLPKQFNSNRKYFENAKERIPFVNVNPEILPNIPQIKEYNLESLLDYIRQKGFPNGQKPDFITQKQILQLLAQSSGEMTLFLVRIDGIIYIYKDDEGQLLTSYVFHFKQWLMKTENDGTSDGRITKGVFRASFDMGNEERCSVLYSGKIDAIDGNKNHYEVRVACGPLNNPYFWENQSFQIYWQSFFGNVKSVILGLRTRKYPNDYKTREPMNYPPLSVYEVQKMNLYHLYSETNCYIAQNPSKRQFSESFDEIQNLLKLAKETLTEDGDGFVFSRKENDSKWEIRRDDDAVAGFRRSILMSISSDF